jgi:hypothetical protein
MIALTLQSVAKRVQDLIFGGKFWIECRLVRRHTRLAVNHVENRLVTPRVSSWPGGAPSDGRCTIPR